MAILVLLFSAAIGRALAAADDDANREYQIKAAMIFNFAQFAEWPANAFESADSPLVIAVEGSNPFGDVLEQLVAGRTISRRRVVVKFFPSVARIETCHLLFIPGDQGAELNRALQKVQGKPVLTVGETDAFPKAGGVIRFFTDDNKLRFEINTQAAEQAHLTISSKLLKLARIFKQ